MAPSWAWAYQTVRVGPAGATVYVNPRSDSATLGTLRGGQSVNINDQPRGGYYRITAAGGLTGWVQEDLLVLPRARPLAPSPVRGSQAEHRDPRMQFGVFAGMGIVNGGSSMAFGAQVSYRFSPYLGAGGYFQYLGLAGETQNVSVGGVSTPVTINSSLIMLAGELNFFVPQAPGLRLGGKLGVGIASAGASVSTNAATTTATSTTSASSLALGVAGAVGYEIPVTPVLSLGGEGNLFLVAGGIDSTIANLLVTIRYGF